MNNVQWLSVLLALGSVTACSDGETQVAEGSEDGACRDDETCDDAVTCQSGLCVPPDKDSVSGDGNNGEAAGSGEESNSGGMPAGDGGNNSGGAPPSSGGGDAGGIGGSTGGASGSLINWSFDDGGEQWKSEDTAATPLPFLIIDGRMCVGRSSEGPEGVSWPNDENADLLIPVEEGKTYVFRAGYTGRIDSTYPAHQFVGLCPGPSTLDHHFVDTATAPFEDSFHIEFFAKCETFGIYVRDDSNGTFCFDDLSLEEVVQ